MSRKKISHAAAAVVTGAGSGIGRAFALEIARRGGRVVCADIDLVGARETVKQIKTTSGQTGGGAWAVACDVGDFEAMRALQQSAWEKLGGSPDLVVNNAGIGVGGSNVGDFDIEDWRATVDVNLWGVVHGCHLFTPAMRHKGCGGIINVCSAASFAAAPKMAAYNTTKAAVLALSETMAAELTGSGVHVTALCPTFVSTNIVRDGRIAPGSARLAELVMRLTGIAPEKVARRTLNALDRGQLYVLPQFDARTVWRLKRFTPSTYYRGAGLLGWAIDHLAGPPEVPVSENAADAASTQKVA